MTESDETLVLRLKEGRIDAFRALYDRHQCALLGFAGRILGNHADAEDAVHDAFMTLYEKVGGFRGQSSFTTWFYRILVNACLQIRRKRGRVEELHGERELIARTERLDRFERVSAMTREVDALPMRQRMVFYLAEVEGWSLKETSRILGLREGTVRHHFFKAKESLRERLLPLLDLPDRERGSRLAGRSADES